MWLLYGNMHWLFCYHVHETFVVAHVYLKIDFWNIQEIQGKSNVSEVNILELEIVSFV